jgi:hypothetical protein
MSLTNIFIKNVKHTGATSGDKYTDGRDPAVAEKTATKCAKAR